MKWTQIIPQIDAFPRKGISSSCQCYTNPDASYPFLAGSCFGSGTLNRPQMSPIQVGPFYRPSARMGAGLSFSFVFHAMDCVFQSSHTNLK
jgi:hypothetical protein